MSTSWRTEDVRNRFMIDARKESGPWIHGDVRGQQSAARAGRDFASWLAAHDVQVKAEALREFRDELHADVEWTTDHFLPGPNSGAFVRVHQDLMKLLDDRIEGE